MSLNKLFIPLVIIWNPDYLMEYLEIKCERCRTGLVDICLYFLISEQKYVNLSFLLSTSLGISGYRNCLHVAFSGYWLNKAHIGCKLLLSQIIFF